jgi:hypothetical protein
LLLKNLMVGVIEKNILSKLVEAIRKYGLILAIVLPVLTLVIIRLFGTGNFKPDAQRWAEPSIQSTNILTIDQLEKLTGNKLFVLHENINGNKYPLIKNSERIFFDSILDRRSIRTIRKYDGPVIVFSDELSISARTWMFISQMGLKEVFILSNEGDNEVLKEQYRSEKDFKPVL